MMAAIPPGCSYWFGLLIVVESLPRGPAKPPLIYEVALEDVREFMELRILAMGVEVVGVSMPMMS